jgi:hypothetical protein
MTATTSADIWTSLYRAGTRFLALENSDYLFLERTETGTSLSAATARQVSSLEALTSEHSITLLDQNDRVEALMDLAGIAQAPIRDFSVIRTVALAPLLGHRLGQWNRLHQLNKDLWVVSFNAATKTDDLMRTTLEQQILEPWLTGQHISVPHRSTAAADPGPDHLIPDFFLTGAKHFRSLIKLHGTLSRAMLLHGHYGSGKSAMFSRILTTDFDRMLVHSYEKMRSVEEKVYRDLSDKALDKADIPAGTSTPTPVPQSAVNDLVDSLKSATRTLDSIYENLTSTAPEGSLAQERLPEAHSPAPESDPIQNAIQLRGRLQTTVRFVDAATWAQWRGVTSNPSAALGKYKKRQRIFAVRSSKRDLYPAFQFSDNAEPLPIIEEILKVVPAEARGWSLLSWFEAQNTLLDQHKPSEVLADEPLAVLNAATRFYSRDD